MIRHTTTASLLFIPSYCLHMYLKKTLIAAAVLATMMPSALADYAFSYGPFTFSAPASFGPTYLYANCTDSREQDRRECTELQPRVYHTAQLPFTTTIFPAARFSDYDQASEEYALTYGMSPDVSMVASFDNFKDLLSGKKQLSDFYDENGGLKDNNIRAFIPVGNGGAALNYVRDVQPITVAGNTYGFAYTPLLGHDDWPYTYDHRYVQLYLASSNMFVQFAFQLPMNGDIDGYLKAHGRTSSDGEVDYTYYQTHMNEYIAALNTVFDATMASASKVFPTYYSVDDAAKEFLTAGTPHATFNDVPLFADYSDAVEYVHTAGYVSGYADGTFRPETQINRAEFLKILVEAVNKRSGSQVALDSYTSQKCFSDVAANQWYTPYVCYAKAKGIIGGYPDGSFQPDKSINLAESLKIILNAYGIPLAATQGGDWFDVYMGAATNLNMLSHVFLTPSDFVTRGEMAELIMSFEVGGFQYE